MITKHKYNFYQSRSKYKFCEIPNDEEGKLFIKQLRKYLNKGTIGCTAYECIPSTDEGTDNWTTDCSKSLHMWEEHKDE